MPFLDCNNTRIFYDTAGESGEGVLMIQGVGTVGEGWCYQRDELAKDHRVLWFDNRGIGKSAPLTERLSVEVMAEDCLALLDHMGWEKAHVVGHSMGGVIAQEVAYRWPERLHSLTLASTLACGRGVTQMPPKKLWLAIKSLLGTRPMRRQAFIDMAFSRRWQGERSLEELHTLLSPMFGRDLAEQPSILNKQVFAVRRHDLSNELQGIATPTLILHGEEDVVLPVKEAHRLKEALPTASLHLFEGQGHGIMVERAEEFNRLLLEHFQACESKVEL